MDDWALCNHTQHQGLGGRRASSAGQVHLAIRWNAQMQSVPQPGDFRYNLFNDPAMVILGVWVFLVIASLSD